MDKCKEERTLLGSTADFAAIGEIVWNFQLNWHVWLRIGCPKRTWNRKRKLNGIRLKSSCVPYVFAWMKQGHAPDETSTFLWVWSTNIHLSECTKWCFRNEPNSMLDRRFLMFFVGVCSAWLQGLGILEIASLRVARPSQTRDKEPTWREWKRVF